ncbi:hypothetical protein [Nitrosomonas sp.]|uniref:hypothetical protein n=1 Tax=Nitrosomonas sp. TaxID=42353 RepID=UPI003305A380
MTEILSKSAFHLLKNKQMSYLPFRQMKLTGKTGLEGWEKDCIGKRYALEKPFTAGFYRGYSHQSEKPAGAILQ